MPLMSSRRPHGLITLCLLLSCRFVWAVDQSYVAPINPATVGSPDVTSPSGPPALMALPANSPPLAPDASSTRKFYTLSAELREIYDDNVGTTHTNPQAAFETELSPSVLVDFPTADNDFSARYTFDLTYYSKGGANGETSKNGSVDYTHEFVAQYKHSFSDRFNLNVSEQFRYYTEPSIYESVGTPYRNGAYVSNSLNGTFTGQWTPLLGSTTTYSNTIVRYDEAAIAQGQDSIENTASQSINFSVAPKIQLALGGIIDDISYDEIARGYTNYTGFAGAGWQVLPSLNVTVRGGGSYIQLDQAGTQSDSSPLSPYAAFSLDWSLGARSELTFDYAHEVTPTYQTGADAQSSDRVSANLRYDITPFLSAHLQGIYTESNISQSFITSTTLHSYNEDEYSLDTGLTYKYNTYLSIDGGVTLSGVDSGLDYLNYTRDETYVGIRGTY